MIDQVQDIKDRLDIVEVISTYLTLKKAGANYKCNCPFHNEKSPSFMISPERQTFKCYGCGEGGDVISFVEKIEGLDFYNALKLLADRAGVELKTSSVKFGQSEHKADNKTKSFEINEWTKKVYHKILLDHPKAEKAREYLKKRGLKEESIHNFEIGYAPNSWDFILKFLHSKGFKEHEAVEAGVAIKSENGKIYDRFRGRIIFPINNIIGNTIAFTSRILEDDGKSAKYINSAESPIYTKGKTIYGLDKAKLAIKEAGLSVLVEGNMDVIACHQAGFLNVVATSGTALTLEQLKILTRYSPQIAFCFDSDNAGQTAMKRAIRMALQNDITTKIITTSPFKDPDEAIKEEPDNWSRAVKAAKPSLQYWIDQLISARSDLTVDDKKVIAKEILPEIKNIASEIEKEHYIHYLAQKLSVSETSLIAALGKAHKDKEFVQKENAKTPVVPKLDSLERLIALVWSNPNLVDLIPTDFPYHTKYDSKYEDIIQMILVKKIDRQKVASKEQNVLDQMTILVLSEINPENENAVKDEILYLVARLRSESKEGLKEDFARKIQNAEEKGDTELLKKLLLEFSSLIK